MKVSFWQHLLTIIQTALTPTLTLFVVIDLIGNIPFFVDIYKKKKDLQIKTVVIASMILLLLYLYVGVPFLNFFGVDVNSFALAGAIVMFLMGLEMVLNMTFFREGAENTDSVVIPIAFPLVAGTGSATTLISLRSQYPLWALTLAIGINLILLYFTLRFVPFISKKIKDTNLIPLRKLFGIILLALSIKLFKTNF
jgi:multiple antibiotic resistance protein